MGKLIIIIIIIKSMEVERAPCDVFPTGSSQSIQTCISELNCRKMRAVGTLLTDFTGGSKALWARSPM